MKKQELINKLTVLAEKAQQQNRDKPFQLYIHSPRYEFDFSFPPKSDLQPFHIASISKLISTVALLKLIEEGKCRLDDLLIKYMDPKLLEGIFLSPMDSITIKDCLTHRSGAADYFEGKTKEGTPFLEIVTRQPNTYWTQEMILEFARTNLKPIADKGSKFAYGDTAFMCAMIVIEK